MHIRTILKVACIALGAIVVALAILFAVLAVAQYGAKDACPFGWTWFGCALREHDGLAGGLLGALVTLAAAWVAWSAVQRQIKEARLLAHGDRSDAKRLLSSDLAVVADGLGAVWRIADRIDKNDAEASRSARIAIMQAIERITEPENMKTRREMVGALGWEDRSMFASLVNGIEALRPFAYEKNLGDFTGLMDVVRGLSYNFEYCLPKTAPLFEDFPRGWPKAMSFGDLIRRSAGVEGKEGYGESIYDFEEDERA
ncbi:MAG: hypothetical protein KDE55_21680 [Novosphingobium sp.]|nr:hypothetical protein [Novosphingobium sp.]